jgi:hypothetical protein
MTWLRVVLFMILLSSMGFAMGKSPAHYVYGNTVILHEFDVGSDGGTFVVEKTNTVLDGTVVEVPPGSLKKRIVISLGYDDGRLDLKAGKGSGIVLVLSASGGVTSFDKAVKITVNFDASIKPITIIGYAIDRTGALRPIDTITSLKSRGIVSFYTFKPLTLTWVYVFN